MILLRDSIGTAIKKWKNQAGLRKHLKNSETSLKAVTINTLSRGQAHFRIDWFNGNYCFFEWQSFEVLKEKLRRWRVLQLIPLYLNGVHVGRVFEFTKTSATEVTKF